MLDNFVVTCAPSWEIQASEARLVFGKGTGLKREWRTYQQVVGVFASSSSLLLFALSSSSGARASQSHPEPARATQSEPEPLSQPESQPERARATQSQPEPPRASQSR